MFYVIEPSGIEIIGIVHQRADVDRHLDVSCSSLRGHPLIPVQGRQLSVRNAASLLLTNWQLEKTTATEVPRLYAERPVVETTVIQRRVRKADVALTCPGTTYIVCSQELPDTTVHLLIPTVEQNATVLQKWLAS